MEVTRSGDPTRGAAPSAATPVATPDVRDEVARALRNGPVGALIVAGIAVALLFIGWLIFYFFLFRGRGDIG
jgi:hypothetical protein